MESNQVSQTLGRLKVSVPNVPKKVLKEMFLTAARLLQLGKLKPEEVACRLRFLGTQLTLGELAEPFSRDRFTELFLESEKWQRTDWSPAQGVESVERWVASVLACLVLGSSVSGAKVRPRLKLF